VVLLSLPLLALAAVVILPLSVWVALANISVVVAAIAGLICALITLDARFFPNRYASVARALRARLGYREVPGLPPALAAVSILCGGLLGTAFYVLQINLAQRDLVDEIRRANVFERALRETPIYPVFENNPTDVQRLAFTVLLDRLGLITADTSPADIFGPDAPFRLILDGFSEKNPSCGSSRRIDRSTGTLDTVVRLSAVFGCSGSGLDSNFIDPIAGVIARRSGVWDKEKQTIITSAGDGHIVLFSRPSPPSDRQLLHALFDLVSAYKTTGDGKSVLRTLLGTHLSKWDATDGQQSEPMPPALRTLLNFQLALLGELHRDERVTAARTQVDIWLGYEQFAIIVLAFVLAALILARWIFAFPNFVMSWHIYDEVQAVERQLRALKSNDHSARLNLLQAIQKKVMSFYARGADAPKGSLPFPFWILDGAADDLTTLVVSKGKERSDTRGARIGDQLRALAESRKSITFAFNALPALGFLGTVHGILNGLGGSIAITSTDRLEQAAGISLVSSSLGLAFSTTLIALAAALLLGFFDMLQHRSESLSILDLGRKLHLEFLS
jgi:hypothetical protein